MQSRGVYQNDLGLQGILQNPQKKQIYKNADDLISAAKELKRLKGGVRQGRVIGNIDEIFQSISQGGQRIGKNSFRLPDGTIITKYSSSTTGVPTIHINKQGQLCLLYTSPSPRD